MGSFLETYDDPYVASHAGVFREGRNYDSPKQSGLCGRPRNRSLGLNFQHASGSFSNNCIWQSVPFIGQ